MQRSIASRLAGLLAIAALACTSASERREGAAPFGPWQRSTPDGLVEYERPIRGTLYLEPSHGISAHHQYLLSQVVMSYAPDSVRLFESEEQRMLEYVQQNMAARMNASGMRQAEAPGPCVLAMGLGLVDVSFHDPTTLTQSTNLLASWGAITLVVDLRDSATQKPLARYGRRVSLPGGVQWQDGHPAWRDIQKALDVLLTDHHRVMSTVIPASGTPDPACLPATLPAAPSAGDRTSDGEPPRE